MHASTHLRVSFADELSDLSARCGQHELEGPNLSCALHRAFKSCLFLLK